jgi:universal stress protein A
MAIKNIACCTDFSENADSAFNMALDLAEKYKAKLFVIHVLPPPVNPMLSDTEWVMPEIPRETLMQKLERLMDEKYSSKILESVECQIVVLDGHVSSEIIKYLETNPIDLVVLGSYGLTGMGLVFFGSVAKRVAHKAPCSVMIARG